MSRKFILKEAREDRRVLLHSSWRDKRALYNHYASNYVYESDLRGIPKSHVACCMMVAERHGIHPQELINEGIWGSIKNFFKRGEKAAEKKDETMDVSEEEIQAYMDSKAGVFKRWEQAKKDGSSTWQSLKHAFGGIGSMFQQGQQVWDITGKEGAKLQIQAKKGFDKIKDQLESDFLQPIMKDLNTALKDPKLGKPQSGGFPNNPRAADFRHMLYGHTRFQDLEASGEMKGIFGYMLAAKDALQKAVDNVAIDTETANATVKKMVKVLQYYNGALDDSKRSLESRRASMQRGNLLNSYSLELSMMGSDYWYREMLKEGDEGENEGGAEVINISDLIQGEAPEGADSLSPEDAKALGEFFADPDNNKPPGGLSDKALNNMKAADSALKPLIVACIGAAFAAIGVSMGGNPFGDFEDSYAFTQFMNKLQGVEIRNLPDTIAEEMTEYTTNISVQEGEGFTQMAGRTFGMSNTEVSNLSMGEFKKLCAEKGLTAQAFEGSGMMKDPDKGFEIINGANDDSTVAAFFGSFRKHAKVSSAIEKVASSNSATDVGKGLKGLATELGVNPDNIVVKSGGGFKAVTDKADDMFAEMADMEAKGIKSVVYTKVVSGGEVIESMTVDQIPGVEQVGGETFAPVHSIVSAAGYSDPGTIAPGNGNHPLSMFVGKTDIKKKVYQSVLKKGRSYVVKTFASGAITKSALAKAALPTILATTGTALVAAGVSIAVLRKVAKSRQKTLNTCIKILSEPIKDSPKSKDISQGMEKVGVQGATDSEDMDIASPHEELEGVLQFPRRELEKSGYPKEEIDDLFDTAFDSEKNKDARDALLHSQEQGPIVGDHYSLVGHLLTEDMEFGQMGDWIDSAAKEAGITGLSDKNKAHLAMGINVGPDIGEITGLPGAAESLEAQKELEALRKKLEAMSDEKQGMADDLAQANAQYFLDTQEIEGLNKEVEDLMKGNKSLSEVIEQLEEKVKNGEIDAQEAIKAKENLENQLKAVQLAAEKEQALLQGQINNLTEEVKQYMNSAEANMQDLEKIEAFSEEIMGEPLVDILRDPEAFAQRFMDKKEKEQQKVLDDLKNKDKEITSLEEQLKASKAAQAKKNSYGKIFQYLKKLLGRANKNKRYSFSFADDNLKKFMKNKSTKYSDATGKNKASIDSLIQDLDKTVLKDMGVQISHPYDNTSSGYTGGEHRSKRKKATEARWHQGPILAERWAQLAGLPAMNESNYHYMNKLIAEGIFTEAYAGPYDDPRIEENLKLLEAGNEVMMEEDELIALEEHCEFNQIDHEFEVHEYGNGFSVSIIQNNPYGRRR